MALKRFSNHPWLWNKGILCPFKIIFDRPPKGRVAHKYNEADYRPARSSSGTQSLLAWQFNSRVARGIYDVCSFLRTPPSTLFQAPVFSWKIKNEMVQQAVVSLRCFNTVRAQMSNNNHVDVINGKGKMNRLIRREEIAMEKTGRWMRGATEKWWLMPMWR